jgi:hypothetical protein
VQSLPICDTVIPCFKQGNPAYFPVNTHSDRRLTVGIEQRYAVSPSAMPTTMPDIVSAKEAVANMKSAAIKEDAIQNLSRLGQP